MEIPFLKVQSVGNDFVLLDNAAVPTTVDFSALAIRLCDRRFGVGADGLLLTSESSTGADLRMRMYNPDGSEDMCGNGLRCVVRHAFDSGRIAAKSRIETLSGIRDARVALDGAITANMGAPGFAAADIPTLGDSSRSIAIDVAGQTYLLDSVNTGSTHSVIWRETPPTDSEFLAVSPLLEHAPVFPERTSVLWATAVSRTELQLRIWERGAGETLGCGTGACAAAVLARATDRIHADEITVHSRGGALRVAWNPGSPEIWLTGYAEVVFAGVWHGTL